MLDVLHRAIVDKEPYAAIAAKWSITVSCVSKIVRKNAKENDFLQKLEAREDGYV